MILGLAVNVQMRLHFVKLLVFLFTEIIRNARKKKLRNMSQSGENYDA